MIAGFVLGAFAFFHLALADDLSVVQTWKEKTPLHAYGEVILDPQLSALFNTTKTHFPVDVSEIKPHSLWVCSKDSALVQSFLDPDYRFGYNPEIFDSINGLMMFSEADHPNGSNRSFIDLITLSTKENPPYSFEPGRGFQATHSTPSTWLKGFEGKIISSYRILQDSTMIVELSQPFTPWKTSPWATTPSIFYEGQFVYSYSICRAAPRGFLALQALSGFRKKLIGINQQAESLVKELQQEGVADAGFLKTLEELFLKLNHDAEELAASFDWKNQPDHLHVLEIENLIQQAESLISEMDSMAQNPSLFEELPSSAKSKLTSAKNEMNFYLRELVSRTQNHLSLLQSLELITLPN